MCGLGTLGLGLRVVGFGTQGLGFRVLGFGTQGLKVRVKSTQGLVFSLRFRGALRV